MKWAYSLINDNKLTWGHLALDLDPRDNAKLQPRQRQQPRLPAQAMRKPPMPRADAPQRLPVQAMPSTELLKMHILAV